jgi:[DsrC]-trisulfide reductase subunit J
MTRIRSAVHAFRWIAVALLVAGGAVAAGAAGDAGTRVSVPHLDAPRGERCVMDTAFMRRNHMNLLLHQRDRTVHEGVRTSAIALQKCIGCHANEQTGSVIGSDRSFCQGCHSYAAVKLDCFDCHSSRTGQAAVATRGDVVGAVR